MEKVQVLDKSFRISISEAQLKERITALGKEISDAYKDKDPLLVSVLNGAFMFTSDLIREIDFDAEVHFIRLSSYGDKMESSGKIREVMGLEKGVKGRHILLIEDIVDTGHTLDWIRKRFEMENAASVKMCSLLFKEEAFQGNEPPEFIGFTIPNAFVVGYGLDYAHLGRTLSAIYELDE